MSPAAGGCAWMQQRRSQQQCLPSSTRKQLPLPPPQTLPRRPTSRPPRAGLRGHASGTPWRPSRRSMRCSETAAASISQWISLQGKCLGGAQGEGGDERAGAGGGGGTQCAAARWRQQHQVHHGGLLCGVRRGQASGWVWPWLPLAGPTQRPSLWGGRFIGFWVLSLQ